MGFDGSGKIWLNGKLVDWNDATIHLGAHVVHYGSSVFEGIRMYHREETDGKSVIFRLREHMQRLYNSAKIYRMTKDEILPEGVQQDPSIEFLPYTLDELEAAVIETLKANDDKDAYVRPFIYRGYKSLGVDPRHCPVDYCVMTWRWGKYLGPEALEQGIDVAVSSWTRFAPNTLPAMAKTGANYMNSQLIKQEAIKNGYVEGIALDINGFASEGSGENLYVVFYGKGDGGRDLIITPPLGNSVLPGITRDTLIQMASVSDIEVREQQVPREMLYTADEVFFSGTAAEVTPIRSVDRIKVGAGHRGHVAKKLQDVYFGVINGTIEDKHNWLTFVDVK